MVRADAEGKAIPLKVEDVKPDARPLFAWPLDPSGTVRNGSRLNKVLLVKLDPASLDQEHRKRSAEGVLAFSGVCTHEACEVTEWVAAEKALLCVCHATKFVPTENGRVSAGPAPRGLPHLPIAVEKGELVVAGKFSASPGAKKA